MLREPQLQTKRGSLSPYLVVHLAADVHCGLLPVSHLPLLGSYTLLVPSKTALHTQLHPHEPVRFVHPESSGCPFEGHGLLQLLLQEA